MTQFHIHPMVTQTLPARLAAAEQLARIRRDQATGQAVAAARAALRPARAAVVLPSPGARWTAQRKIDLINAINAGELTRLGALVRYGVSEDELDAWIARWARWGTHGLMARKTQELRP